MVLDQKSKRLIARLGGQGEALPCSGRKGALAVARGLPHQKQQRRRQALLAAPAEAVGASGSGSKHHRRLLSQRRTSKRATAAAAAVHQSRVKAQMATRTARLPPWRPLRRQRPMPHRFLLGRPPQQKPS